MSSDKSSEMWIGTPQCGKVQEDVLDAYTTKLGGQAVYFRTGSDENASLDAAALSKHFACPQCKSVAQVSLLSQVYAPLEVYDRVLYIFTCAACAQRPISTGTAAGGTSAAPPPPPLTNVAKKSSLAAAATVKSLLSFCFAVRSQNFSREYFAELRASERAAAQRREAVQQAKAETETPLFDEGDNDWGDSGGDADDWGDGAPEKAFSASPAPLSQAAPPSATLVEQTAYPLAPRGTTAPLKGVQYTKGIPLDLYVEATKKMAKELSIEEQLAAAESMYGDNAKVDTSGFEEDDETPAEECVREYLEEMERNPSQCVRWCPGGTPLRTTLAPIGVNGATAPPPCPACGAPRQFEMQLTAPTVYFLTKAIGEAKNTNLHFSNVLVYTCSKHCYAAAPKNRPYLPEYVTVEDEL